jgi:SAM-dependent methyltransferase
VSDLSTGTYDTGHVGTFLSADPWGEDPLPYLAGQAWHFVKCNDCGQMFHRFVLDAEWNERRFTQWMTQDAIAAFEKAALTPDSRFSKAAQDAAHVLRIRSLVGPRVKLLDFGCGYGDFIAMCNLYGFQAVGVDRAEARRGNASIPIFPDLSALTGPFDVVTLFEVLEHLDDPRGLLERVAQLMTTDAVLILETPDCTGVTDIQTIDDYRKIHPLDHINAFTPETLRNIAERAGFKGVSKPTVHVTADRLRVAKNELKGFLSVLVKPTTQQYFRRIS